MEVIRAIEHPITALHKIKADLHAAKQVALEAESVDPTQVVSLIEQFVELFDALFTGLQKIIPAIEQLS